MSLPLPRYVTHAKTCAKTYNAYHNPSQDTRHVPRPLPWGLSPIPYHGAITRAMAPPTMVLQPVPRHVTCDTCHYLCHNPYEDAKTYVHNPCEDACQEPYMTCIIACEMMRATTPYHSAMPRAKTCDACSHPCQACHDPSHGGTTCAKKRDTWPQPLSWCMARENTTRATTRAMRHTNMPWCHDPCEEKHDVCQDVTTTAMVRGHGPTHHEACHCPCHDTWHDPYHGPFQET